jgi:hypothetical protein
MVRNTRSQASAIQIFGIRHHGPGSARSLGRALAELRPDIVLIEGPPEADPVLPLLAHPELEPPVALLVYAADEPGRAVFFPMARFSPELQAVRYAVAHGIPVRCMDLPQFHQLVQEQSTEEQSAEEQSAEEQSAEEQSAEEQRTPLVPVSPVPSDPLTALAQAAGYSDGERWWEQAVEQRRDSSDIFAAVNEAMAALRETSPTPLPHREVLREAWMRRSIRAAQKEGFTRIAVVCGAWHAPALAPGTSSAREDDQLLRGLPKLKTVATVVPWTYGRLTFASGYGAGIASPGWYDHLWAMGETGASPELVTSAWMTLVARLLRQEDLDASAAHVIEAVRLAEALAALRERFLPGLPEQRRLRLPPEASWRDLDLDLRNANDRARSLLLRRLNLLGIGWGQLGERSGTGTFRERWRVQWDPDFDVRLIEAGIWGTTVQSAAAARALALAHAESGLPALVGVVNQALFADLPTAVEPLLALLQARAARSGDAAELMDALIREDAQTRSSLANSLRYGSVRELDVSLLGQVVDGLVARICVGVAFACASLDDEAAAAMFARIQATDDVIRTLQRPGQREAWLAALLPLADNPTTHGLVAGRCCRILLDATVLDAEGVGRRLSLALSTAAEPPAAAAWIEGLLRGSGTILLHDDALLGLIDRWIGGLGAAPFQTALPLLRRTFSSFAAGERRMLGERAARPGDSTPASAIANSFDEERAAAVLVLVTQILRRGGAEGPQAPAHEPSSQSSSETGSQR